MPMSRARNSGSSSSTGPQSSTDSGVGGRVRVLFLDAVEELLGLGREQRDLLLLDEHRQQRVTLAGLDHERARARAAERAGADRVDGIELDVIGHASASSVRRRARVGSRSARPPVSLHFTSMHAVRVEVEDRRRRRRDVHPLEQVEVHAGVVRDRRLDRVGVAHDDDRLVRVAR